MALSVVLAIEFVNSVAIILTEAQLKRDLSAIQCLFTFYVCSAQFDCFRLLLNLSGVTKLWRKSYKTKTFPSLKILR